MGDGQTSGRAGPRPPIETHRPGFPRSPGGKSAEPLLQAARQPSQSPAERAPGPVGHHTPQSWGPCPTAGLRVLSTRLGGRTPGHHHVIACGGREGGGEAACVLPRPFVVCFSEATGFLKQGILPMVTSMTKRKAHRPPHPRDPWRSGTTCVLEARCPLWPWYSHRARNAKLRSCKESWQGGGGGTEKKGDVFLLQTILSNSKKIT